MAAWVERYNAGEHAEVWADMEALGEQIREPVHRTAAQAVVRETMSRANTNVQRLFKELLSLGYKFQAAPEPSEPDYPLELRIEHALDYVTRHDGGKNKSNPWSHPALAWVEDEEIELPARFRAGRPGRANYRPPSTRTLAALAEIETARGNPLPLAARAWFENVGSIHLGGTHPFLNRGGVIVSLRVTIEEIDLELSSVAGAEFVSSVRHAFAWAGFPGWAGRDDAPQRELDYLRSKLLPL